jgi:hypothetical protein
MPEKSNEKILKLLEEKVLLKQEVFDKTKSVFDKLKNFLQDLINELSARVKTINRDLVLTYTDTGEFECEITLGDETLVFVMHTNIFTFDNTHQIWRQKYVLQDSSRSYCGKIFIYNFLSDSFRFNRVNDVGYLIARIFINREGHYFVEGKKQLGNLYSDFSTSMMDESSLMQIVEAAVTYSLNFDPFTPPFETISQISVREVIDAGLQSRIATGKRLGFQFENDKDVS